MIEDLRIPASVRRKIGMPPGLITVRFGASGPQDEPGGYNYEISADDRALIDQVIKDNQSPDELRRKAAYEAWSDGLWRAAPSIGPAMLAPAIAGSLILNLLGKRVLQPFDLKDGGGALGSCNTGSWTAAATGLSVGQPYTYTGGITVVDTTLSIAMSLLDWSCGSVFLDSASGFYWMRYTMLGVCFEAKPVSRNPSIRAISGDPNCCTPFTFDARVAGPSDNDCSISPVNREPMPYETADLKRMTRRYTVTQDYSSGDCFVTRYTCNGNVTTGTQQVCPGGDSGLPDIGDLGAPGDLGFTSDIPDLGLTEDQLNDLLDSLKDSPYYDNYAPPPVDDGAIPITPGPGPGGTGGDPGDIGDIGDPGAGDVALDPSDPGFPCGPPSGFNLGPGLDNLKQDRGIGKSPYSSFKPPPDSGPDDFKPGTPVCLKVAGSSKKCGTVGNYVPPDLGKPGHVGVFHPPRTEDVFTHARCYKNKNAGEIAKALAKELGVDPDVVVDDGCKARFTGCFKKGSSKWDAMWKMADLCGYGVFPPPCDDVLDPNCSGNIGPIHPLPIHHGPYHENRDVFSFSRVYDDTDVPAYVVYWRPPYKGDAGFEIVVKVDTIYAVPQDKWEFNLVPRKTTEHEAATAASRKAAAYGLRGLVAEFAVPYNPSILERHQVKVRRPSEGIDINYMAIDIRHDLSAEGWLTIVRGSELRTDHYAPTFEEVY